jgi:Rnl2 family RNA ligase
MEFKRYSSIENSDRTDWIEQFRKNCDVDIFNIPYIITEKIDGANIQFMISSDKEEEIVVCKRNSPLKKGEDFYDVWSVIEKEPYSIVLRSFKDWAIKENKQVRLFGELHGPLINKRINYGDNQQIKFFDIYVDDVLLSQKDFCYLFFDVGLTHVRFVDLFLSPKDFNVSPNLASALNFDLDFLENIEGVIIQPYNQVIRARSGERFILKKKAAAYCEKIKKPLRGPSSRDFIDDLNDQFKSYITENRVLSVISKNGEMKKRDELGKYIAFVLNDAIEEFEKDHEEVAKIEKKELKRVYNVGKMIANLLLSKL